MNESETLISDIDRVRRKLNFRLMLGAVAGLFTYLCAGTAVFIFLWRLGSALGWLPGALWFARGMAIPLFIGICTAGIPFLAVFNRHIRLDRVRAAEWLDERLHAHGVLGAALACLDRNLSDDFSEKIHEGAAEALEAKKKLGRKLYPYRNLRRVIINASASFACLIILLSFLNPLNSSLALRAEAEKKETLGAKGFTNPVPVGEEKLSDADLARRLFSEDSRLEALAEQALRNKDSEALAYLMKESGLNPEDIPGFSGETEMPDLPGSTQDRAERGEDGDADSKSGSGSQEEQNSQGGRKGQEGQNSDSGAGKQNSKEGSPKPGDAGEGEEQGENKPAGGSTGKNGFEGSRSGAENSEGGDGGLVAGNGAASETAGIKNKRTEAGADAVIKYRDKSSPVQFVMPGKKINQTLAEVIPDALRSSEAAMSRSLTPLEYEAFVKSYFTALSKESKQ